MENAADTAELSTVHQPDPPVLLHLGMNNSLPFWKKELQQQSSKYLISLSFLTGHVEDKLHHDTS